MKYKKISRIVHDRKVLEEYKNGIYEKLQIWYHLSEEEAQQKMKQYKGKFGYMYNTKYKDHDAAQYMVWNLKVYKNMKQYKNLTKMYLIKNKNYTKKAAKKEIKEIDFDYYYNLNLHPYVLACGVAAGYLI